MQLRPPVTRPPRPPIVAAAEAVLAAPGDLDRPTRTAILERAIDVSTGVAAAEMHAVPEPLGAFVDKIARHAYTIVDADVHGLRDAGHSEDALFEALTSAAIGAGLARLACGLAALEGAVSATSPATSSAPTAGSER